MSRVQESQTQLSFQDVGYGIQFDAPGNSNGYSEVLYGDTDCLIEIVNSLNTCDGALNEGFDGRHDYFNHTLTLMFTL
jgi:hypothetical protein